MKFDRKGRVHGAETAATVAALLLTGLACCGWFAIQWLGLLIWVIGGTAAIVFLKQYEVLILVVTGALSLFAWRLTADRFVGRTNAVLGVIAIGLGLLRFVWDLDSSLIMAIGPLYELFNIRPQVLFAVISLVLVVRAARLLGEQLRAKRR